MADFRDIIRKKPHLIWYTKDYDALDEEAVVEAVLNYGNWDDVQELIQIMGIKKVMAVFEAQISRPRYNYFPEIKDYFHRYFQKYA